MSRKTLIFVVAAMSAAVTLHAVDKFPDFKPGKSDAVFKESPPHSDAAELKARFHGKEEPPAYDVSKEKFRIIVPKEYSHKDKWGLFVWVNAGDSPDFP